MNYKESLMDKMYKSHPLYGSQKYSLRRYKLNVGIPSHLIFGVLGNPIFDRIITGPCYLTPYEIKSLNSSSTLKNLRHITRKHPTFEDVVCSAVPYPVKGTINNWQETHHYAKLVANATGLSYQELVPLFEEEAIWIFETQQKFAKMKGTKNCVNMIWTHEAETLKILKHLSAKNAEEYSKHINGKNEKLLQVIKENPSDCDKLQIVSTYNPEANGGMAVAIESLQNLDNIYPAHKIFGISAILLAEPKDSKAQKPRMNSSSYENIVYLGPDADLSEEMEKLQFGTRTPVGCGIFGLIWHIFDESKIIDFHDSCKQTDKITKINNVCQNCLHELSSVLKYLKGD